MLTRPINCCAITLLSCCVLALLALSPTSLAQQTKRITVMPAITDIDRYSVRMLTLALARADTQYEIIPDADGGHRTQGRYIEDLRAGRIDVMWAASDASIEAQVPPVRIPLLKGLLGHRIFLIHKNSQHKFDAVNTLDDLKKLKLGQGSTWADTNILESNGLTVVKTQKYGNLFYMLDGGRFDAFPRGVQEPWGEVNKIPGLELAVEKRLMLVYKMPFYLFVAPDNQALARDIENGFNAMIADGTFDYEFLNDPSIKKVIDLADLKNRKVFYLDNPALPKATPVDRPELWLDINSL
ncbi:ABC transporter substrate-binding protein [Cellvibrio sp. KY-YJ-3]|uniref:substrate-binding periplasmic protein n=1 Tax=Cellvibrio sp. KY-YJ-3 TaxID=454662 RepID=UPI0012463525|nr:transporter substrate-binding domain-containing protein [Cellvibrio sp. KY-YJ-3]QEY12032.1 diguanylate cyclase [Cellvibrio sp. KY-YJ-3]